MTVTAEIEHVNADNFEQEVLQSKIPVIVYCYMNDAGLCKLKYGEVKQGAAKLKERVKVVRLDVGESKDLAFEHSILSVPSMLYVVDGEIIQRWTKIAYTDSIEPWMTRMTGSKFSDLGDGIVALSEDNFNREVLDCYDTVVVNFWKPDHDASWVMKDVFKTLKNKYGDKLKIGVVNFDQNRDLATRYRISKLPAAVFFKNGDAKERLLGVQTQQGFEEALRSLREKSF